MPRYDRYLLRLPETALGVLAQFRYQNSHSRGIGCLDRPSPKLLALPSARDIRQTRKSSDQMPAQSSRIWDCLTVLSETTARNSTGHEEASLEDSGQVSADRHKQCGTEPDATPPF